MGKPWQKQKMREVQWKEEGYIEKGRKGDGGRGWIDRVREGGLQQAP